MGKVGILSAMPVKSGSDQFDPNDCYFELIERRLLNDPGQYKLVSRLIVIVQICGLLGFIAIFLVPNADFAAFLFSIPILTPVIIAALNYLVLLPEYACNDNLEDILATPISSDTIAFTHASWADQHLDRQLRPLVILYWLVTGILIYVAFPFQWSIGIILLLSSAPWFVLWLLMKNLLRLMGLVAAALPARRRNTEFLIAITVPVAIIIIGTTLGAGSFPYLFMSSGFGVRNNALLVFSTVVFIMILGLVTLFFIANHYAGKAVSKRRTGEWS